MRLGSHYKVAGTPSWLPGARAGACGVAVQPARPHRPPPERVRACRDAALTGRIARFRQYLSVCGAGPSEVLANVALKATEVIVGRNLAMADANLLDMSAFLARHPNLFEWTAPEAGVVGYVRYGGTGGVERFVTRMAADAAYCCCQQACSARILPRSRWTGSGLGSAIRGSRPGWPPLSRCSARRFFCVGLL